MFHGLTMLHHDVVKSVKDLHYDKFTMELGQKVQKLG